MIQEVLPNIFRVEVPLPGNPLKATNSYVIKAQNRNLIVDTGMNRDVCRRAICSALTNLSVNLRKTDFFITHFHSDHSGLVPDLATNSSTIYINEKDANFMKNMFLHFDYHRNRLRNFAHMNGFPESELKELFDKHPGYKYRAKKLSEFTFLKEGDKIIMGNYIFECIETPGHTKGHMCLYEPNEKVLVAGDHILKEITPNISLWSYDENPLYEYLASLDKVYQLDVKIVLPGHRHILRDCKRRILEIKGHHRRRLHEILSVLKRGGKNAYQIASYLSWGVPYTSWELFPVMQKWFAVGEVIAHLKYLEDKGLVQGKVVNGIMVFKSLITKIS